jgi:hypothetical protein
MHKVCASPNPKVGGAQFLQIIAALSGRQSSDWRPFFAQSSNRQVAQSRIEMLFLSLLATSDTIQAGELIYNDELLSDYFDLCFGRDDKAERTAAGLIFQTQPHLWH